MRKSHVLNVVLGAALLAGCGSSEPKGPPRWSPFPQPPPRDENFRGGPNAMLLKYDANHDGSLTRAEMNAGLRAEFDAHDQRKTGCLDPDQAAAINAERIAADQSTATPLQDWNQDGCIDFREFATAVTSLFAQLDRNGDGTVSALEFNPRARPADGSPPEQGGQPRRRRGPPGGLRDPQP